MSTTDHTVTGQARSDAATSGPRSRWNWWRAIGAAAVAATVVNLLILLIGRAAGASFEIVDGGTLHVVTVGEVITSSVGPLVIGTLLATALGLWWPGFIRLAQVIGGALALLTVAGPMMADTDTATQLALAAMHVVVGVAVVLALQPIWRRARRAQ